MSKLALLSDIHVGKYSRGGELAVSGETCVDVVKGAVPLVDTFIDVIKDESVEYLLITGDLTSTGSPLEYLKCNDFIKQILAKTGIKPNNVIWCLGNHDFDRRIEAISLGVIENNLCDKTKELAKKQYLKIAASTCNLFLPSNTFKIKGPAPYSGIVKKNDIAFFVLNSGWECSQYNTVSNGKLCREQLEWFKKQAEKFKNETCWKIITLHHHPFNYPYPVPSEDLSLLVEGSELIEIAGSCGFDIVCHGHRHHPRAHNQFTSTWKKPITFICSGSFSVYSKERKNGDIPNCFHIINLIDKNRKAFLFSTYQFDTSKGGIKLRNHTDDTPLDADMYFEKVYSNETKKNAVEILLKNTSYQGQLPDWKNLPVELKTMCLKDLNNSIKDNLPSGHQIYGAYSGNVAVFRRSSE